MIKGNLSGPVSAIRIQRRARAHAVRKAFKGQQDLRPVPKTGWGTSKCNGKGKWFGKEGVQTDFTWDIQMKMTTI